MKSSIVTKIRNVRIYFMIVIIVYIIGNTYFGWNRTPQSVDEVIMDDYIKIAIALGFGYVVAIVLNFIKFIMMLVVENFELKKDE